MLLMEKKAVAGTAPPAKRISKRWLCIILLAFAFVRMVWFSKQWSESPPPSTSRAYPPQRNYDGLYRQAWAELAHSLQAARPTVESVSKTGEVKGVSLEQAESEDDVDVIELPAKDLASLQLSHSRFVQDIHDRKLSTVYQDGRQGIVITADYATLPSVLVQLRLLRRTSSILPVEVFLLSSSDYDRQLCEKTLPRLGASCKILDFFLSSSPMPPLPEQFKSRVIEANEPLHKYLSVLFSSFEDNLFLDPATFVYNNPDSMLREEPYLSSGLILWPDFWLSSVSSQMANIQKKASSPARDNIRTIDLGQFIISKSKQSGPLFLSIYYAYYGAKLYDELLMQSNAGERGSQSIKAASLFLDSSYYLVRRLVESVGYPDADDHDRFRGVAMLQSFSSDDYHQVHRDNHRPAFIKAASPMMNPTDVMEAGVTHFRTNGKQAHRMWQWFSARHTSNGWRDTDPERALWEEMSKVACSDSAQIRAWPTKVPTQCEEINTYREEVGYGSM